MMMMVGGDEQVIFENSAVNSVMGNDDDLGMINELSQKQ